MRLYFDYRSIPELASLEPQERERVLRVSGRTFGKTRAFWVMYWLGILMSFGVPAATWFAVRDWSEWILVPIWLVIAVALVSYTLWFQVRMHFPTSASAWRRGRTKKRRPFSRRRRQHAWRADGASSSLVVWRGAR